MSERGSFCTEYVNCPRCFEILKKYLLGREKFLCSTVIPTWEKDDPTLNYHPKPMPIIAGKIGGMYNGEECIIFRDIYKDRIEAEICHPVRVVVMADSGKTEIFELQPLRGEQRAE